MEKECSKCGISKSESEYSFRNKSKNIHYLHCKSCQKIVRRLSYESNREYYLLKDQIEIKNRRKKRAEFIRDFKKDKPCVDCGVTYPYYVMDFDHLPQFEKRINIGSLGKTYSEVNLLKEFEKCELVCANCHRERTHIRKLAE